MRPGGQPGKDNRWAATAPNRGGSSPLPLPAGATGAGTPGATGSEPRTGAPGDDMGAGPGGVDVPAPSPPGLHALSMHRTSPRSRLAGSAGGHHTRRPSVKGASHDG